MITDTDPDAELLRRYAEEKSEAAFAELVRRRVNLVYSVALRQCGGDASLAEDVTQKVFADLARKAAELSRRAVLTGWLYRSAQFAASDVVRAERRRRAREEEAHIMQITTNDTGAPADWEKVRPVLDEAMGELADADRDAVALRFFEERSFAEIGRALQLSEEAARKRVDRAVDKLHALLAKRGVRSTIAALALILANQGGVAAPIGLTATVTSVALANAAGTGTWLAALMSITRFQLGLASVLAAVGATAYVLQGKTNADLHREIATAQQQRQTVETLREENRRLAERATEVELLRRDDLELKRLAEAAAAAKAALVASVAVENSIAVLPFANLSGKEQDVFIDGMHADILTGLAQKSDLRVISRAAVMEYRGTSATIRDIGKNLGVSYVIEGSVRRVGDKIRVTLQLLDTRTDQHLWAESYDRDVTGISALQSEIAQRVAGVLQAARPVGAKKSN